MRRTGLSPLAGALLTLLLPPLSAGEHRLEGTIDVTHANHESEFCYVVPQKFPCPGDTMSGVASVLRVFEDGKELGPAHSMHEYIRNTGRGAFSHWHGSLYFSASDNTDPRTNGRKYIYCVSLREEDIAESLETAFREGSVQVRLNRFVEPLMPAPLIAKIRLQDQAGKPLVPALSQTLVRAEWVKVLPATKVPPAGLHLVVEIPMKVGEPIKVTRDLFPPRSLPLDICSKEWAATTKGQWKDRPDSRLLRGMCHPWEASEAGAFAQVTRAVRVPADWVGPVVLQFHVSDNYVGVGYKKDQGPHYVGADIFLGHRFKRVLVDDNVVWERDVCDDLEPTYFLVDLSNRVKPGQAFQLSLRVADVASSKAKLPGDDHMGWTWDPKEFATRETANRSAEIDAKFETNVYWGDVGLTNQLGGEMNTNVFAPKPGQLKIPVWRPPHRLTAPRSVTLPLEAPGGLPAGGFPVSCGVPFAPGELTDEQAVQLFGSEGKEVPLQIKVLARWPDGSLKWLLFDFIATGAKPHTVRFGPGVKRAPVLSDLRLVEGASYVEVHTRSLDVEVGHGPNDLLVNEMAASMIESGQAYRFLRESVEFVGRGPIRASVKVSGYAENATGRLGRFVARIEAYAGLPYVRLILRVFNDAGRTLKVSDLSLTVPAKGSTAAEFGVDMYPGAPPLTLQQANWQQFDVRDQKGTTLATGERAPGWVALKNPRADRFSFLVAVRHFRPRFPKSLEWGHTGLTVRLFAPTKDDPFYEPTMGEALSHELLLCGLPAGASPKEVAEAFQNPPRLFDREYFCGAGGLGDAVIHDAAHLPTFHEAAKALEGELNLEGRGKGIRHFPDTYSGASTGAFIDSWMNFYHDTFHGMCLEYLMTGDRRWFDLAEASARHYMDVDIIHHWPPNPSLVGLPHGTGPNHTGHDPYSLIAHLNGLVDLYFLTGDPDAWEAAIGVGEGIMRNNYGFGGSSRDQGWPMQGIGRLYRETRDPKYLNYLHRLLKAALSFTMTRRGTYHEMHSTLSYRGQVPFMNAILGRGLMFLVQDTGDPEAAFLLVQIAKSLSIESQQEPGWFNYSPNPYQRGRLTNYNFLLAPMFLYAYELSGDRTLLDTGIAAVEQAVEQKSFWLGGYFNAAEMLYLLNKLAPDRFAVSANFIYALQREARGSRASLDGTSSFSSAGKVIAWNWDLDGTAVSGAKVTRFFTRGGALKVKLTVKDEKGNEETTAKSLQLPPGPGDFGEKTWGLVVRTEAETFTGQGGGEVHVRDDKLAASGKSLSHWNGKGHWLEWEVDIPQEGDYFLMIRYATPENAARVLTTDGQPQGTLRCQTSGGYGSATADNWYFATLNGDDGKPIPLRLAKGVHKVRLENQDGMGLNIDYLELIARVGASPR